MSNQQEVAFRIKAYDEGSQTFKQVGDNLDTLKGKSGKMGVKFKENLDNVDKGLGNVQRSSAKAMGGMALVFGGAVKAAGDFDHAMTKSVSIMSGVTDNVRKEMEKVAMDLSDNTAFSATQVADAYFYMTSAGMGVEAILESVGDVASFATAGQFDLATATDLLTDALSALGMSSKDEIENKKNMIELGDTLVKANTLSNATVQQFSESLTAKAGTAIKAYNLDMKDSVAILALYADKGIKGAESGNMLSRAINRTAAMALKNGDEFKKLGITVYDNSGKMRDMGAIAADMSVAFEGMSDKQKKATLTSLGFRVQAQAAILPLLGATEKIDGYRDSLNNADGTMQRVAETQRTAFNVQMKKAKNLFVNTGIALGTAFLPAIIQLAEELKPVIENIRDFVTENQGLIVSGVKLAGGFLAMTFAVSTLGRTIIGSIKGFKEMKEAMKSLKVLAAGVSLPMLAVGAAVALVAVVVMKNWGEIKAYIMGAVNKIKPHLQALGLKSKHLGQVMEGMKKVIAAVRKVIQRVVVYGVKVIIDTVSNVIISFVNFIDFFKNIFTGEWGAAWQNIKNMLAASLNNILNLFGTNAIAVKNKLKQMAADAREATKNMMNNMVGGIKSGRGSFKSWIGDIANTVGGAFSGLGSQAWNWGGNMMSMFINGIKAKRDRLKGAVSETANSIKRFLGFASPTEEGPASNSDKRMPNMMDMMVDGIEGNRGKIADSVSNVAGDIKGGIGKIKPKIGIGGSMDIVKKKIGSAVGGGQGGSGITVHLHYAGNIIGDTDEIVGKMMTQAVNTLSRTTGLARF